MKYTPPTQEYVQNRFIYEPATGLFKLKKQRGSRAAGDLAGCLSPQGYRQLSIKGRTIGAHRLAWLYVYGVWPDKEIDHINHKRDDNRIENLRIVNRSVNSLNRLPSLNNPSGHRGVSRTSLATRGKKYWQANISVNGHRKHLGNFYTLEEAIAARAFALNAVSELHSASCRSSASEELSA